MWIKSGKDTMVLLGEAWLSGRTYALPGDTQLSADAPKQLSSPLSFFLLQHDKHFFLELRKPLLGFI